MSIADAVLARLATWAGTQASLISVFDTTIPGIPPADSATGLGRYLVVSERTSLKADTVGAVSLSASGEIYVTSAAWLTASGNSSAQACRWLVGQVQSLLTDWTPVVSGLVCGQLAQVGNPSPMPEETLTDRHLVYAADQFHYEATRTS